MKFLITLIILIFIFRLVLPHLLRWAIKAFVKKSVQNGTFQSGTFRNGTFTNTNEPFTQQNSQPEGKIKVDYVPKDAKAKPGDFSGGEYVDYEEVK